MNLIFEAFPITIHIKIYFCLLLKQTRNFRFFTCKHIIWQKGTSWDRLWWYVCYIVHTRVEMIAVIPSTEGKILEKTKDWVDRSKLSTVSEGYANSHSQVPSVVILLFKKPVKRHKIEKKTWGYDYKKDNFVIVICDTHIP